MYNLLIVLDKHLGVRPVGLVETRQRMMEKCVLKVTGQEAKEACRTDQLCGGIEAGIKGGIHIMRLLCQYNSQEEDWGFLIIYAKNGSMRRIGRQCCGPSDYSGL